jgi:hypothetical protein
MLELWRAVGVRLGEASEVGLGTGAIRGVPDGAQLSADGFSCGSGGGVVDAVAGQMELAALPGRAREDCLASSPDADLGGLRDHRWR